ncbi:CpsD/CapB family tyrosine-protein kinase [Phaeobacter porticola]|uniref:ATPase involved in chromosome partitioning n=1 Tax=Phaeobacter porticola TaxID=1844006 RepID=A0A1L3I7V6_9RHOB|nr:CpsD/CapB family tyrosine-protein kinase [Phaeobacter porticola]APG48206.1 ATPase involved in chromosome partitioning [Phaeobacter porticola]
MKDLVTGSDVPLRSAQKQEWDKPFAMTQQGFKRFRRRKGRDDPGAEHDTVVTGRGDSASQTAPVTQETAQEMAKSSAKLASRLTADDDRNRFARRPEARQTSQLDGLANTEPQMQRLPATVPEVWERLHRVPLDIRGHQAARSPLVNFFRNSPTANAFDLLRTRLLHSLKAQGWKRVAIAAPTAGCGSTFSAVNLALSMARVPGTRTILMDLNFRRPGIASALKLPPSGDMPGFLSGDLSLPEHLIRPAASLAVGLTAAPDRNAAEILHDGRCAGVIDDMVLSTGADVTLFDLPPVLEHDDTAAFLPQVDGVLLIADGTRTTAAHLAACEKMFEGQTQLLGVSLNRARGAGLLQYGQ